MDVIGLHQAGFMNTAGVLGTALTTEHTRLLRRIQCETVVLLMDSDEAGTKAALRAIPELLAGGLKVKVLQVSDAKDPDEYIQLYGPARFGHLLETAQSHVTFRVNLLRKKYNLQDTAQRVSFTQEAAALLASLSSAIEADAYAREVAMVSGIDAQAILAETKKKQASGGGPVLPAWRGAYRTPAGPRNERGLHEARRELINLVLSDSAIGQALSENFNPEEMGDEFLSHMLKLAYDLSKNKNTPADIITRFETLEEQQQAAAVLNNAAVYTSVQEKVKALNHMALLLKRAWLDRQIEALSEESEKNAVIALFERKKNLQTFYINI
jgi:DNA primase